MRFLLDLLQLGGRVFVINAELDNGAKAATGLVPVLQPVLAESLGVQLVHALVQISIGQWQ